ncbi:MULTISPECIES: VOC family protein [unclassified Nocardia]|uniref:VOC family protein n=1 Tax=unclassified Nocardia TaxID=2637762 RepID=UPI001CE42DBB|nr:MULTISPECIES: VOC family protein [unclassified Nocardia]
MDHLVLATPTLAETVDTVARALGLVPVAGGRHSGLGTRNFLLGLGDGGYLEIIGADADQPEPERPRPFGIDELAEPRLVTWAVQVHDIDAAVAAAGLDPDGVRDMSRTAPDGTVLRWRLTNINPERVVPFLIDWGATVHPSTGLPRAELRSLTATHPDPAAISARLQALSVDLPVQYGATAALLAVIVGPAGAITLV